MGTSGRQDLWALIADAFRKTQFKLPQAPGEKPVLSGGRLFIPPALLRRAAEEAFSSLAFYFRESHLELLAGPLSDPELSPNDRWVLSSLLENALIAARGELALCQDTGTAVIYGWKDEGVYTGGDDGAELEAGTARAYEKNHLRFSQIAPSSFFEEYQTGNNLPAQIRLEALPGEGPNPRYCFLFAAKGGGSSNKTAYFSKTKALLEENAFDAFLAEKIPALGTAACPPYRLAVVVGGTSPEVNLEVLKLATTEILDGAPFFASPGGSAGQNRGWIFRDPYWENRVMEIGRKSGLGAQFGGTSLLLDARVLRLTRHAASCPVSIGVSCNAHRNLLAYIDGEGLHLEKLAEAPGEFFARRGIPVSAAGPGLGGGSTEEDIPRIGLDRPLGEIRAALSRLRAGDRVLLSGKLLVARDAAHLRWHTLITRGRELPEYLFKYPIYYAGPAATPPGKVIGSLGPTTAQRMDPYGEEFMSRGASLVTLAKGNRSPQWRGACKKYGGFYLGAIGGAAALSAERHIISGEIIDYPELGMEAVRLIEVRDLPAFILIDDKGEGLYPDTTGG
ncbi:MAG: FumA C-terminus/TtdB family hydratase beta subunit [Spirochaetaceae bacterium]|jgi:fumarate hydratase class I|nr:FumA C-terminus/TtdB family hydratase beta subunit [Spirochaetaceae bacterium]